MLLCEHSHHVGSDLVSCITVGGNTIRSHDDAIDFALLHDMSRHVVGNDCDRNVVLGQFPRRQACTLKERPRLVCNHGDFFAGSDGTPNHAQRGAVISGSREGSGIAMSKHRRAILN